jgi:prepilin-type N-terminal cleavage/methylation domain-containing protein
MTLLEIMIVVAVLAILAAIAIPNFVKARTTSCKSACIANLKQIDGAVQQWALANKKATNDIVTVQDILEYLKGSQLPACPGAGTYSVTTVQAKPRCSGDVKLGESHSL